MSTIEAVEKIKAVPSNFWSNWKSNQIKSNYRSDGVMFNGTMVITCNPISKKGHNRFYGVGFLWEGTCNNTELDKLISTRSDIVLKCVSKANNGNCSTRLVINASHLDVDNVKINENIGQRIYKYNGPFIMKNGLHICTAWERIEFVLSYLQSVVQYIHANSFQKCLGPKLGVCMDENTMVVGTHVFRSEKSSKHGWRCVGCRLRIFDSGSTLNRVRDIISRGRDAVKSEGILFGECTLYRSNLYVSCTIKYVHDRNF